MLFLKQATASQSVLIGPFVDSTDGVTAETGLTIANTDIRLSANGGNMFSKTSGGGTHDEAGWYTITLDATDTATVGRLQVSVAVSGALPVFAEFQVLEEAIFDALLGASATGLLPANVTQFGGSNGTFASGRPEVNATHLGGTSQTGRDIGASVLLSSGTGTGQLDFTSGVVKANLAQILGTALTETAGQIAAAFKKFFDVATPTGTVNSLPDAAPDAAGGLPISDAGGLDLDAQIGTDIDNIAARLGTPSDFGSGTSTIAANLQDMADNGTATFDRSTDSLQAIRDHIGDGTNLTEAGGTGDQFTGIAAVGAVTGNVGGNVTGTVGGLSTQAKADVNAEADQAISDAALATAAALATVDGIVDNLNLGIIYGSAVTGTLSTTQATTDLTGYADDQLIGAVIIWTSGDCEGERTDITDSANTGGLLTFTALTTAPANGDTFKIV